MKTEEHKPLEDFTEKLESILAEKEKEAATRQPTFKGVSVEKLAINVDEGGVN